MESQRSSFGRIADDRNFDLSSENSHVLILKRLVYSLRAKGCEVVVVAMPEHSEWRVLQSRKVEDHWNLALAGIARNSSPLRVVDLRVGFEDELFFDLAHLNLEGQRRLSQRLPAEIFP